MPGDWVDERELQQLEHAKNDDEFTDAQRAAIEKVDAVLVRENARPGTRSRFARKAKKLAEFLEDKPFEEATREDLGLFFGHIAETYTTRGVRFVKSFIRRFYTLLLDPYDQDLPDLVSWIKVNKPKVSHQKPPPLLKPEDIKALLEAARCQRDRALISVLYESGARVSELCGLTVDDVEFDQYGARITVDGKTGIRRVRLIQSAPDLKAWLNLHQHTAKPGAPLFTRRNPRNSSKPLMQSGIRNVLRKTAKDAGIEKPVNPHAFRKARATELSQRLTPSELSVYLGWVQGSTMPQVYIHLAGDDVEEKLLQQAGKLTDQDQKPHPLTPLPCPSCGTDNSPANQYCTQCNTPLQANPTRSEEVREHDQLMDKLHPLLELLEDPDIIQALQAKKRERTANQVQA